MRNDETVKTLFNIKGVMAWLCDETESQYPHSTKFARRLLLVLSCSYLTEFGFSDVNDLLSKKRNQLDITKRGDLRLKLNKLKPNIKYHCRSHEASGCRQQNFLGELVSDENFKGGQISYVIFCSVCAITSKNEGLAA
ncbi:SCAN domain-containing protein 3 [Trichonephila clavipes]|nr:SCAN domain-containing protein 3 [Trichonephila clavipes]